MRTARTAPRSARRSSRGPGSSGVNSAPVLARQRSGRVLVGREPSAVLRERVCAHAGQPGHEVRFRLVRVARQVRPLVRDDEGALDVEHLGIDDDLEEERIRHAVDRRPAEIPRQHAIVWARREPLRDARRARAARPRTTARATAVSGGAACAARYPRFMKPAAVLANADRGVARHAGAVVVQLALERHAAVVEAPEPQEEQIQHRRAGHRAGQRHAAGRASRRSIARGERTRPGRPRSA